MSRNTGLRLDRVGDEVTIYHEGPVGTFPTVDDFTELSRSATKLRSDNIKIIYDDGAGIRRAYFITSRGNLCYTDLQGTGTVGSAAYVYFVVTEAVLTAEVNKVGRIYIDFPGTILEAHGSVISAPTGANLICDVNLNGTSIWSSNPGQRLTIDGGTFTETQTAFTTTNVVAGDYLTLDVDQVGSTVAGEKLVVRVKIARI